MLNIPPMGSLHENTKELLVFLVQLQQCCYRSGGVGRAKESQNVTEARSFSQESLPRLCGTWNRGAALSLSLLVHLRSLS